MSTFEEFLALTPARQEQTLNKIRFRFAKEYQATAKPASPPIEAVAEAVTTVKRLKATYVRSNAITKLAQIKNLEEARFREIKALLNWVDTISP